MKLRLIFLSGKPLAQFSCCRSGFIELGDDSLVEAAKIDGMGKVGIFFKIIFPLTWATVSTLIVLTMTGMFSNSGPVLLFTQGSYGTSSLGYWLYHRVYFDGVSAYNEVLSAGLMLTLIGAPVILFVKWLIERVPVAEF